MNKVNSYKNRIFLLIGFMASGKSFLGRKVADKLKCDFVDLDEYLERVESCSIKDIILNKGEAYFRELETKHFEILINQSKKILIIASGGGLPLKEENRNLMKKVSVIYIDTDFDCILSRLNREEIAKRPLLKDLDSDGIKKLYKERVKIYEEVADYKAQNYNEVLELIINAPKD